MTKVNPEATIKKKKKDKDTAIMYSVAEKKVNLVKLGQEKDQIESRLVEINNILDQIK